MSVINQMLRDLDARAVNPGDGVRDVLPAAVDGAPARSGLRRALVPGLVLLVLAMLAFAAWMVRKPLSKPTPVAAAAPVVKTIVLAPVPVNAPVPSALVEPAPVAVETPPALVPEPVAVAAHEPEAVAVATRSAPVRSAVPKSAPVIEKPAPAVSVAPNGAIRVDSPYRRALSELAAGRKGDAIAALEQALQADPRNRAARETLVGLLIEARRNDEAVAQLQAALALDARQPALAMLMARLQIEQGGDGIDTLLRALPFAGAGADGGAAFHAFLAGALQRGGRHREAVAQYQAALRLAPENGVWWMGLGLALRSDGDSASSAEAFRRARASGLSSELDAFVARQQ